MAGFLWELELHIQLFKLAGQGISSPTQEACRFLLVAMGMLQGGIEHDAFELRHRLGQNIYLATRQLLGYPLLQLILPVLGDHLFADGSLFSGV